MDYLRNPKILGSFLIGFALVGGTYTLTNFGEPRLAPPAPGAAMVEAAPVRTPIPIKDSDGDGVGDWRDQFITTPAITIDEDAISNYVPPTTLTGRLGVSLVEDMLRVKIGGPVAKTTEQILQENVAEIRSTAITDDIYDIRDIRLGVDTSNDAIRTYGNALAEIVFRYNVHGLEGELDLLFNQVTSQGAVDNTRNLRALASMYKNYRDATLALVVPPQFARPHLDLINVYNALYLNIASMAEAEVDPLASLVRLRRYEEDVQGLGLALANIYDALRPHSAVFVAGDPVIALMGIELEGL